MAVEIHFTILYFDKKNILNYKPDAIILVDYPGFNLRIAEFAKRNNIPVYYYISPQVWAWRKGVQQFWIRRIIHTIHHFSIPVEHQQSFAMAHQLALLEAAAQIDAVVDAAGFKSHDAKAVCMVALANYFAGAVILPYGRFLAAATEWRYDIGALAATFGASQEQVCHRLSTMQRPGMEGIPFYFLRVDRAGNITKRHSATRFQFARYGGACPLWNVHEAFEASDRHLVQVAEMPDGVRYLSMALAITKRGTTAASPTRRYAIGFGCELAYADRVVYADGIDLRRPQTVVPIGISCRLCDRNDCAQRAFPPVGCRLTINPNQRMEVPYEHSGPSKKLNAP